MEHPVKPYGEQTTEERIACLDRMLNVLAHQDWRELHLHFADEAATYRRQMEDAPDWETFVANRAVYLYVSGQLMKLAENVKHQKEELDSEKLAQDVPLPPADYEIDP